ncbi:portal protein [Gordonia phage Wojtek]|uniref:Portal protein n=1 Tax=Gordonia phage Wojtek TaxID=2910758 RepID=A0AA49BMT0_9CAUD|nr:portal protein [Gordonia phage Wojtek]
MTSPQVKDTRAGGRYASAVPFATGTNANIVNPDDALRWKTYQFYDDVYHNRPETFAATIRGEDDEQVPIYLPSAGTIVEAVSRFLGVDFSFQLTTAPPPGQDVTGEIPEPSDEEMLACQTAFEQLFKREKVGLKYETLKRYGLVRGDALIHITADDTKAAGRRISIHELNPGQYFPIKGGPLNDQYIGCHIIGEIAHPTEKGKFACLRQTYRYIVDNDGNRTGGITTELTVWELGKWDDRDPEAETKQLATIVPEEQLPAQIDVIPVYHVKNEALPGDEFGRSELSGFETMINGINQSITDEDMTLVMQGLGMYATNAPPPVDAEGKETDWQVGPGQVIEVGDGQTFSRINGVSSVAPFQEHIRMIEDRLYKRLGLSDVAVGDVDTALVESGIALKMKLAPILARNAMKEAELVSVLDQMFYDLAMKWFPAYEGLSFGSVVPIVSFGDPMPVDRKAVIDEVMALIGATPPLITLEMAVERLSSVGYTFGPNAVEDLFALMARISDTLLGGGGGTQTGEELEAGDEVTGDEEEVQETPEEEA